MEGEPLLERTLRRVLDLIKGDNGLLHLQNHDISAHFLVQNRSLLVDKALGMMGYDATQACRGMVFNLVDTIISLLLSTIHSGEQINWRQKKPKLRERTKSMGELYKRLLGNDNSMQSCLVPYAHVNSKAKSIVPFGSCLSVCAVHEIMKSFKAAAANAYAHGNLILQLLEVLLKVANMTTMYSLQTPAACVIFNKESKPITNKQNTGVALNGFWDSSDHKMLNPIARYHAWRLQPHLLKIDLSVMLHEVLKRPLMSFSREIQQRNEWKNLVVSLALAPDTFMEARHILHSWLVFTGLYRVWQFWAQLAGSVQNVIDQPSIWGLSHEKGLYLPPVHAFYPQKHRNLLKILNRPATADAFAEIVDVLNSMGIFEEGPHEALQGIEKVEQCGRPTGKLFNVSGIWALVSDFRQWFHFALSTLFKMEETKWVDLFNEPGNYELKHQLPNAYSFLAARYVAWYVCPLDKTARINMERMLLKMASKWCCAWQSLDIGSLSGITDLVGSNCPIAAKSEVMSACAKKSHNADILCDNNSMECQLHQLRSPFNCGEAKLVLKNWLADVMCLCSRHINGHQSPSFANDDMGNFHLDINAQQNDRRMSDLLILAALEGNPMLIDHDVGRMFIQFIGSCNKDSCMHHASVGLIKKVDESDKFYISQLNSGFDQSNPHDSLREPAHRKEHYRDTRKSDMQYLDSTWQLHAANIFDFLDNYEFKNYGTKIFRGQKSLVNGVIDCVRHWSSNLNLDSLTLFKDLKSRFSMWTAQGGLTSQDIELCYEALEELSLKISTCEV